MEFAYKRDPERAHLGLASLSLTEELAVYDVCSLASDVPLNSLDPSESPVDSTTLNSFAERLRFGAGLSERHRWINALPSLDWTFQQKENYRTCGTFPVIEYDETSERIRVRTQTCKSRFCPACRKHRQYRWRVTIEAALNHLTNSNWQLITLTQQHTDDPLKTQLARLRKSFRKLRQTNLWKASIRWGIAVIEVTYNADTKQWHPHLHILAPTNYIDYSKLRQCWRKATNGSHIIDGTKIKSLAHATAYLSKYLGKPPSFAVFEEPGRIAEYSDAMKNAKMLLPFGDYPDAAKPEQREKPTTIWKQIGTLESIMNLSISGHKIARRIVTIISAPIRAQQQLEPVAHFNTTTNLLELLLNSCPPDP